MSQQFRLVFSAELVEGQHAAVVKKRLAAVLKLDEERMDVLFSGKSVVVKKAADEQTAARFSEVFKKAGAKLRVIAVHEESAESAPAVSPQDPTPATPGSLDVLPVGADMLTSDERPEAVETDVDTSHLSVQGAVFAVDEPVEADTGPNVDHISLAELGAQIGDESEIVIAEIDTDFDLAEVGAILGDLETSDTVAEPPEPDFDLAEPGADMDTATRAAPPPPPDTSHLKIDDDQQP